MNLSGLKNFFTRKRLIWLGVLVALPVILFLVRHPIMRGMGSYLIEVDQPVVADAIVVLGGNSLDRGAAAAELWHQGIAPTVICLGENTPTVFEILDTIVPECEISARAVMNGGVPEGSIVQIREATSTLEEAQAIIRVAEEQKMERIVVVSDLFHTHRVSNVFDEVFEESGVQVLIYGCSSSQYQEDTWWHSEEGMIMVNNEYMKLLYYWWKY